MYAVILLISILGQAHAKPQVPAVVTQEMLAIQDKFMTTMDEECPQPKCTPVGCQVSRFLTLDQQQTSSLPGLEVEKPAQTVQYKLATVQCSFSHEDALGEEVVSALKQRIRRKVAPTGINLLVSSRRLAPRNAEGGGMLPESSAIQDPIEKYGGLTGALGAELLPFFPWLVTTLVGTFVVLFLLWGLRHLGILPERKPVETALAPAGPSDSSDAGVSPYMIMTKSEQLQLALKGDARLVEMTLKPLFDANEVDELCWVIQNFGSDILQPFREKPHFEKPLLALSQAFKDFENQMSPMEQWGFLARMERRVVAAKIRMDQQPLSEEFAFLGSLGVDELLGILKETTEAEAVIIIAYCPRHLRESFFASSNSALVAQFIEQLTQVEKLPDAFARETARKVRMLYQEKFSSLRQVKLEQLPMLESAMNALGPAERKQLVEGMGRTSPKLLSEMAPRIFLDGTLLGLPDEILTEAFLLVSPRAAAAYLSSFEDGESILERLNPKLAKTIQDQRVHGSTDLADEARDKIAEFVKLKDSDGSIDLAAINTELLQ